MILRSLRLLHMGIHLVRRKKNNPYRVIGFDQKQNYAKFSFSGKLGERKMTVQYLGVKGEKLGEWSVTEKEIRY